MHLPLFVYGTLRDTDLLAAVLGRPLRAAAMHDARAPGFRAVHYPGRIYPALIRAPGAAAPGLLLTDLSAFERDLLDAYEGEEYRRAPIAAVLADEPELHEADAYIPAIAIENPGADWRLEDWQLLHKPHVIGAEAATADEIRVKLIALRPH
jgi:hypothetical protein